MKTAIIIFMVVLIVAVFLLLWSAYRLFKQGICKEPKYGDDHEFPYVHLDDIEGRFHNFLVFQSFVYFLAEKDEEIKNYLLSRKHRHDYHAPDIHDSNVDREADGKNVSPDIQ